MERKRTLGLGIREHGRRVGQARLYTPSCANRTSGSSDIASNRDIPPDGKGANGILAVKDDHKVCYVGADLETPSETACCDARRRRPGTVGEAGDNDS